MAQTHSSRHTSKPVLQRDKEDLAFLHDVASRYWVHEQTMNSIARTYGTSRSTISRSLSRAKELGIVRINVVSKSGGTSLLEQELYQEFHVNAHVVNVPGNASEIERLTMVTKVGGHLLHDILKPGDTLGVAWGTTMVNLASQLEYRPIEQCCIVQMNGAVNTHLSGLPWVGDLLAKLGQSLDATVVHFPVPAFFNDPQCKELMWKEPSIQAVLAVQQSMTVAMFSVGVLSSSLASHVYSGGYLSSEDLQGLRESHVVGDVCTVFIREDGTFADIALNQSATGWTPLELQTVPKRLCVVAGVDKTEPLLAALRAGVATDLVVDNATAKAVINKHRELFT